MDFHAVRYKIDPFVKSAIWESRSSILDREEGVEGVSRRQCHRALESSPTKPHLLSKLSTGRFSWTFYERKIW